MLKNITVGTAIATVVFFILTLCTIPFAVKKQVDGFSQIFTFTDDISEIEIEPKSSQYNIVFKNYSDVKVFKSYDDKIHIDFTGAVVGEPIVTINEQEDKSVAIIDRKTYKSSIEKFFSLHFNQECTVFVPDGITIDLSGDYYLMQFDNGVLIREYIDEVSKDNGESENYNFYRKTVGISDTDLPEAAIKKLVYAGSLVSTDYAQGDISKPDYIDFVVMLKNDISEQCQNLLENNENPSFRDLDITKTVHCANAYVQSQLDYICLKEKIKIGIEEMAFSSESLNDDTTNLSIASDGKLVLAKEVDKDEVEAAGQENSLRESEKAVLMARKKFIEILNNAGIDDSEAIYVVNIFKI